MKTVSVVLAILLMISLGIPATAHHSAAAQDFTKKVEVNGIVKSWRIMNPHGKLQKPFRGSIPRSISAKRPSISAIVPQATFGSR